ncbi:hypothetical protein FBUS_11495 [Fasciolopsis buskii]|uniref:Peptidoglycan recognition protein family domain-containing protein n=1 Tax=Fasciolopsis buskii TaxID=27845 RepID=A0A8E0VEM9_9TREM|nr:hypothetical protein FBUS_11495 [Fasciolopsis buski]
MFLHYIHINQNQVNEDGEYEWGDAMDINQLGLVHNPLLLWKVQCCLSSLSTTIRREVFGPAAESDNIKREVEKPFHPNQLTSCMCEDAHNRLILMANREDLECISKQNYEQWKSQEPKKFATAPTAFFVSKMEEIAVFTEKKLELIPFDDPRWNEGYFTNRDRIWIPVLSNLFLDLKQWAGPLDRLASCSLLRCRVQVDNNVTNLYPAEDVTSAWDPTEPKLKILSPERWLEPTCTQRASFRPYRPDVHIRKIVVHDFQGRKFRCFLPCVCSHYLRQVVLEQMKEGLRGIGFNYMIGNDGTVYEGRGMDYEGQHTHGHNLNSYGIAFIGWYPVNSIPFASLKSFWYLLKYLRYYNKVDKDIVIYNHGNLQPSVCPGNALQTLINSWPRTIAGDAVRDSDNCKSKSSDDSLSSSTALTMSLWILSALVIVAAGLLVGRVLMDFQFTKSLQTGGTASRIEHTLECQQWSEVCRRVIRDQQEFRQTDIDPILCQGRYDSFLHAYVRTTEVKLRLAFHDDLKSRGFGKEIALITLFCQSWRSILERTSILPPLILWSLTALRRYFTTEGVRSPIRIQLFTNNTDFMIMVSSVGEPQYETQMKELCSDTSEITNIFSTKSVWNPFCGPRLRLSCLKCDLCQPVEERESFKSLERRKRTGMKSLVGSNRHSNRKKNTYSTSPHEWFQFVESQKDYAKIPEPVTGRYSNFQEFLVYEESRLDRACSSSWFVSG